LVFLADVPGFMIGTKVEKQGIIRHGAKLITAVSRATVPKLSVVVRKAYGAGLYAMCGPGFDPDATLALPEAMIAVMGPEAAVNAVYARKIEQLDPEDRPEYVKQKREDYESDIDIYRLASELIVDEMVPKDRLRAELRARLDVYESKEVDWPDKKHGVTPV
jgi:acetyl-CoA carboxylase carboxyltransferase component